MLAEVLRPLIPRALLDGPGWDRLPACAAELPDAGLGGRSPVVSFGSESRVESLQTRESWVCPAYVFFNLLGLMVTMCKDLPVW